MKKNKIGIWLSSISITLSFILVMLIQCCSIEGGFSIDGCLKVLSSPTFWLLNIAIAICILVAYISFYYLQKNKKLDDEKFVSIIKIYNDRIKLKPGNFNDYIRENNLTEKIRVFKDMTITRIEKLETKYSKIITEKLKSPKAIKLNNEIEKYKNMLTDKYINEHILHLKIKYEEIRAIDFRKDNFSKIISGRKTYSNEKTKLTVVSSWKILTSIIFTLMVNTLIISSYLFFNFSISFFLVLITSIISMGLNAFWAVLQANKLFREEILIPTENKILILEDAVKWASGNLNKNFRDIINDYLIEKTESIIEKETNNEEKK